jgi:flagellar hook-basal body complex protein FliE
MRIDSIDSGIPGIARPNSSASEATKNGADAFRSLLENSINNVGALQDNASSAIQQFLSGEEEDPHKTVMAVQEADLAFDFFMQARNKVVQAYQEIMRMGE